MEYKCITKEESEMQKLLNQWKHEYEIEVLFYNTTLRPVTGSGVSNTIVSALILRIKKNHKHPFYNNEQ